MADLDFLLQGLGQGANLALQVADEERRVKEERDFLREERQTQRLHEMDLLNARQVNAVELSRIQYGFNRDLNEESYLMNEPFMRQQLEQGQQQMALAPYNTAGTYLNRGFTTGAPGAEGSIQIPGVPFSLTAPAAATGGQDADYIRAVTSQLGQARMVFEGLLKEKNITIDQMIRMREENPALFEQTVSSIPVISRIPLIGNLFRGKPQAAAFNYFLPDATGSSQSDRDIQAAQSYEATLQRIGQQALFPGGPMSVQDTGPPGGPMTIPGVGNLQPFQQGGALQTPAGITNPMLSTDEGLQNVIDSLNVPDSSDSQWDIKWKNQWENLWAGIGLMPSGPPGESFRVLSRSRWSAEVETAIAEHIRNAILLGQPVTRGRAIYDIWQTGEKELGRGKGRAFFQNPQGVYRVERRPD